MIFSEEIDLLEKFDIKNNPDGFVPMNLFKKFITFELSTCEYSPEEKKILPEFIYYFCLDVPEKANILQYYYFIFNDENYFSAYIWGIPNNGRLGLSEEQLSENEIILKKSEKNMQKEKKDIDDNAGSVYGEDSKINEDINSKSESFVITKNKIRRILPSKIDFKIPNINVLKIACGNYFF